MKPSLVLFSDFGLDSGFVASMHGVCKQVDDQLHVYDASHLLPPFDIRAASFTLQYTVPYWPKGTVFACIVDPGVGTSRKASVAKLKNGYYIVAPDNGTFTFLDNMFGIEEVREIDESVNRFKAIETVSVFHGRDLFAYCGARLAAGVINFEEVGPSYPVEDIVRHALYTPEIKEGFAKGVIESFDPFGTVETNFLNSEFEKTGFKLGEKLNVTVSFEGEVIFKEKVLYEESFGYVEIGEPILFNDLAFYISLGLNETNFAKTHNITRGNVYDITIEK